MTSKILASIGQRTSALWLRAFTVVSLAMLAAACASSPQRSAESSQFGVLVMAHGGSAQWDESVLSAVAPLCARYPIEVAFGMADAASIQEGVNKLESQGARAIAVVRLFVSGESWLERTEQILGLKPGAPARPLHEPSHAEHEGHSMAFWRIDSRAVFKVSREGLAEGPEMDVVLADRARALSRAPETEDVLILAHGPGDDAENERWVAHISSRAAAIRALPFRRVEVQTLREDWPEKREAAEQSIRAFVQRAAQENGTAIVIPFRVQGFGPYKAVLKDLTYVADGQGLLPHAKVTEWIERQIDSMLNGT